MAMAAMSDPKSIAAEYGILIKPLRQDYSWDSLENKQLKEIISKTHEIFWHG